MQVDHEHWRADVWAYLVVVYLGTVRYAPFLDKEVLTEGVVLMVLRVIPFVVAADEPIFASIGKAEVRSVLDFVRALAEKVEAFFGIGITCSFGTVPYGVHFGRIVDG